VSISSKHGLLIEPTFKFLQRDDSVSNLGDNSLLLRRRQAAFARKNILTALCGLMIGC
jgi:hypothetical protein